MTEDANPPTMQTVAVLRADDFPVVEGVAEGEGITFADELVMDDIYQLSSSATRFPLSLRLQDGVDGFVMMTARQLEPLAMRFIWTVVSR